MQSRFLSPGMVSQQEESLTLADDAPTSNAIDCPDCPAVCQIMGRVGNASYSWCRCGRYIQVYDLPATDPLAK